MSVIEGAIRDTIRRHPEARVFRVDPSVTDAFSDAVSAAQIDNGDVIVMLPGTHEVSATVTVNKRGLNIFAADLGLSAEEQGEKFTIAAASGFTDGPVVTIEDPCRFVGIGFAGRDLTQESLLIDCDEGGGFNGGFIELLACRFSAWYGANDAFIRTIGGAINKIRNCSFDGLFGGVGTAAIVAQNDTGGFAPAYTEVTGCRFHGMGSGKHAIKHATGSVPVSVLYAHNYLLPGFAGDQGKFLDNNNVASTGMCADNWLAPLADQAAAFENMTNSSIGFADNHYEEA